MNGPGTTPDLWLERVLLWIRPLFVDFYGITEQLMILLLAQIGKNILIIVDAQPTSWGQSVEVSCTEAFYHWLSAY